MRRFQFVFLAQTIQDLGRFHWVTPFIVAHTVSKEQQQQQQNYRPTIAIAVRSTYSSYLYAMPHVARCLL